MFTFQFLNDEVDQTGITVNFIIKHLACLSFLHIFLAYEVIITLSSWNNVKLFMTCNGKSWWSFNRTVTLTAELSGFNWKVSRRSELLIHGCTIILLKTEKKVSFDPSFFRIFGQTKSFGHRSKIYFYNWILLLSMSKMFGTGQNVLDWPEVNLDFIRVGH